jgi:hypothetical protein
LVQDPADACLLDLFARYFFANQFFCPFGLLAKFVPRCGEGRKIRGQKYGKAKNLKAGIGNLWHPDDVVSIVGDGVSDDGPLALHPTDVRLLNLFARYFFANQFFCPFWAARQVRAGTSEDH